MKIIWFGVYPIYGGKCHTTKHENLQHIQNCVIQQIILINYLKSNCQTVIDCNSLIVYIFS